MKLRPLSEGLSEAQRGAAWNAVEQQAQQAQSALPSTATPPSQESKEEQPTGVPISATLPVVSEKRKSFWVWAVAAVSVAALTGAAALLADRRKRGN